MVWYVMVAFKNTLHSQNDNLFLKVTRFSFFERIAKSMGSNSRINLEKYNPTNHPFIQKIENLRFFFKNFRCKLLLLQWLHNKSILWLKTQKFLVNKTCDQNIHLWFWINLYTPISYTMLRVQHWIFFWQ